MKYCCVLLWSHRQLRALFLNLGAMQPKHFIFLFFVFAIGCTEKDKTRSNTFIQKVVEAKGYVVPKDSIQAPKTFSFTNQPTVKAGIPKLTAAHTNVLSAAMPKIILAGAPKIATPGKDSLSLPRCISAKGKIILAGLPESVIAKDPHVKDHNPQTFTSFNKLQGLKHSSISCMLQDQYENIWFGGSGNGVCKYDGKSFTYYTEKEGLVNNIVWSMVNDKKGNIWFGTNAGLSKYDGKCFTNFTQQEGLLNNAVRSLFEDKNGNIWFGSDGGVSKYDGKYFTQYTQNEGLANNEVWDITQDRKGNMWFATNGGGVNKFDGNSFTQYSENEGLCSNYAFSIIEDKRGNIWIAADGGGVSKFDGGSFTNYTEEEGLCYNNIRVMLQDRSGNIWFGSDGAGVCKYDGRSFTNFSQQEGLSHASVFSMLEDKSGDLWFGTFGGGVNKFQGKTFTHYTTQEGLPETTVKSVFEDAKGNMWFGSYGGVTKYDGSSFSTFSTEEGLPSNIVGSIMQDKKEDLWFCTDAGLCKYDGKYFSRFTMKDGLPSDNILSSLKSRNGDLWFGTNGGGACKYDPSGEVKASGGSFTCFTKKEGLSGNTVWDILEDKSGNLWFATNNGVTKYELKNENGKTISSFTHFTTKQGLPHNFVVTMLEDKNGDLWFATNGGGVCKYDGMKFFYFTEREGLSSNGVLSALKDRNGDLWFGTRAGLNKLELKQLALKATDPNLPLFKTYLYEDGFLGIGCYGNAIYEAKNGTIWIGANERLTAYHPEGDIPDSIAPTIQLTGLELFHENISWAAIRSKVRDTTLVLGNGVSISNFRFDEVSDYYGLPKNLSLAYDNNYLTFNFIGITPYKPKKVRYQYRLDGLDKNWSAVTDRTQAPYGNIPHGDYTFKVRAMNSEGYWSDTFSYTFAIRPPWWKTWWFRIILAVVIIGSIVFYIKWRERKLRAEKEILEQTVVERTKEVVEEKKIVEEQKVLVEAQKHYIEEKHREITDSINYAERIQRSFLATKILLDSNLVSRSAGRDYFVFFQPKDVVSGDFYWAGKLSNENFLLATADSTGHGVPGAIMSILNISSLERAVEHGLLEPAEIFDHTRQTIIERLKKDGSEEGGKDGMDCSLIRFDFKNNELSYAAANNPVWIVRENEVIELAPDKMPVGKHDRDSVSFTQHTIPLQKGDVVYALTDGFPDQFGGPKGKKFMSKNLKELLKNNAQLPMSEQKTVLQQTFKRWVGSFEQVDDVTVIGIRI
jgi:ligand-binding sensor domain-containing protein/serine phosphatase RsbU (regulator of sigma subunit)